MGCALSALKNTALPSPIFTIDFSCCYFLCHSLSYVFCQKLHNPERSCFAYPSPLGVPNLPPPFTDKSQPTINFPLNHVQGPANRTVREGRGARRGRGAGLPPGNAPRQVPGRSSRCRNGGALRGVQRPCQRQVADHRNVRGGAVRLHPRSGPLRQQNPLLQA